MLEIKEDLLPISESFKRIREIIEQSNNIVISSHINPDGDAIGSELALYFVLKDNYDKNVEIINYSPTPDNLKFLEGSSRIKNAEDCTTQTFFNIADAIFIVDLNNPTRLKSLSEPLLTSKAKKIVIDHHQGPIQFADCYAVDSAASSTGEILWKMFDNWNVQISQAVAMALYTAIMTDTGSFRFPATTPMVHKIVADLIEKGADPVTCYEYVYNQLSYQKALLFGKAFNSLELFYEGKLGIITIRTNDFLEIGAIESDTEDIVERILGVKGVYVGIMLSESSDSDSIRMSFRAKGKYIVRDLAMEFDGGGHEQAAGARAKGKSIDAIREEVISRAKKLFS